MSTLADIFPDQVFESIDPLLVQKAQTHLDRLTKPAGSLGRLEEIAARLYAIGNGRTPLRVDPCVLYTVAGDHGIAAQKVSPFPQAVTRQMVQNLLAGGAASSVLCHAAGMEHRIIDAGCAGGPFNPHPLLIDRRLGNGTADISHGPAMSVQTCIAGLRAGLAIAEDSRQYACIATGEMGISNSTPATALYCALLNITPEQATGPGSGASREMVHHKAAMVARALAVNAEALGQGDPLVILAALGGFEIAIITGIMLGCAARRLPLLVDGFICAAAYAAARAMFPGIAGYAFLTHISAEPAFREISSRLSPYPPLLDLEMRLGEGTGTAVALPVMRAAAAIYNDMATMEAAGVSATPGDRLDCIPDA